jgi:hypothetical protein
MTAASKVAPLGVLSLFVALTGARHRQPGISSIHPAPWPATPGQVAA